MGNPKNGRDNTLLLIAFKEGELLAAAGRSMGIMDITPQEGTLTQVSS